MLFTSVLGLLCNITNFIALNFKCGDTVEEIEDEVSLGGSIEYNEDWTIDNKSNLRLS